jgi:hypothetical protein
MSDDIGDATERPQEKKKLYDRDSNGIRFKSDRKVGDVRIPNYVFDLWMPLLGVEVIGVYALYCRLERIDGIKGVTLDKIAQSCRIGKKTLLTINKTLAEHKFISIKKPKGQERLKHFTTEFTVHDPPTAIAQKVIKDNAHPQGYEPVANWLVDARELPEVPLETSDGSDAKPPDVPDNTSTVLKPLGVEEDGIDTGVSIPRTDANAPDADAATPKENAPALPEEEKTLPPVSAEPPSPPPAAPFAHVAPPGTVWISSADSRQGMTAHLGRATSDKSRPICGAKMPHRTTHIQHGAQPCAACVAKASWPAKPNLKQPPPDVKEYMADLCYGKDKLIKKSWGGIVRAWNDVECPGLDQLGQLRRYWYAEDWRGKKGQAPEPYQIPQVWDRAMAWRGYQSPEDEAAKEAAIMAELAAMGKPRAVKRHE